MMEIKNPYTGEKVGEVKKFSKKEVEEAFENSKNFTEYFDHLTRAGWLEKAAEIIKSRKRKIAEMITSESGICIKSSLHEVDRAYEGLLECAKWTRKRVNLSALNFKTNDLLKYDVFPEKIIEENKKKYLILYEPAGVVSSITPFNHPLNQVVADVGPALAAGNKIVVKPSEKTPLTAVEFGKILKEAGIPKYQVQIVTGEVGEIGDEMITNENIDMISFTGGTKVGEYIASKKGIKKACLELGGNGTLTICDSADLERSVDVAINGAFANSGQRCTAIKRILVFPRITDKFIESFVRKTKELKYGNPMDVENYIGTVINEESAKLMESRVNRAIEEGAKLIYGNKRVRALYSPTIVDYVNPKSELVVEETFGPVAPIIRVKNLEEAIRIINSTEYGLQAGVMTKNINEFLHLSSKIKTGAVAMNDGPHCYRPQEIPFGGTKKSGYGRKGAKYGMLEMSNIKWISVE